MTFPQSWTQTFQLRPKPKQRPRLGKNGRVFTPSTTKEFEEQVRDQYAGPSFDGPVAVAIVFNTDSFDIAITAMDESQRPKHVRADLDNLQKAVLDGLQGDGGAFADDRNVHALSASLAERAAETAA